MDDKSGDDIGADFHRVMVASSAPERTTHKAPPYEELDLSCNFFLVSR